MSFIIPISSQKIMLKFILSSEKLSMRLFSNNLVPDQDIEVEDFFELSGAGYSAISLNSQLWRFQKDIRTVAQYPYVTWTFLDKIGNVYGYYITLDSTGELLWAEKFPNGPFEIKTNGDQIRITPRIFLK